MAACLHHVPLLDCERDMVVGRIGKQVVDIHELYR